MFEHNRFKVAALAASIALAMAATSAMAAAPAANALPGQGKVVLGTLTSGTVNTAGTTLDIVFDGSSNAVVNWGSGTDINKTGTAGFNIGSAETVNFTGGKPVLNIDSSGNASQIFGALTSDADVFVANSNGIIVGSGGKITSTGEIGLIGNTTFGTNAGFTGTTEVLTYNGGGGDVTVQPGASLDGGTVLISGGGNVNVDLGALAGGAASLSAGLSQGAAPATPNANANVAITGTLGVGAGSVAAIVSGGTASNAGVLDLSGALVVVKGALSNTGDLTLGAANGTVVNQGKLTTAGAATFDSLTNAGEYGANTSITINSGGSLTNTGSITGAGAVLVNDGSINNSGSIAGVTNLTTQSDSADDGFAAGGQYYINNTGSITSAGNLVIFVNIFRAGTDNDSTGSFTNTGTLNLGANGTLGILANNNVSLGGTLKAGATPAALSATNPLAFVNLNAGGGSTLFTANGALSVLTPIFASGALLLSGPQVKLMSNVTATATNVMITAGAASTTDYAVRVGGGVTVAAGTGGGIYIDGDKASDNPNVILQGTLSADTIMFGGSGNYVSDVFSGPNGGLAVAGATPDVTFDFTGIVKTASYNNDANFRYNYLPIDASKATGPVDLVLNPEAYTTNGTSNGLSAVNILVDGDVTLDGGAPYAAGLSGASSAVTGVTNTPNTHLVLQSTGNIATHTDFYWPGYVYLGTIDTNTDGSAAPGTLSAGGTITLGGNFTNELPGDVAGASGIHFMSGNALVGAVDVTTNANAWVNFPTDLLSQSYAQGLITTPSFFGGVATGLIVNYGKLDASSFNTHPVDATR